MALALLPEPEARARLTGREVREVLLRPPFVALGVGTLRVLRASERDGRVELVVGYERYERYERLDRRTP